MDIDLFQVDDVYETPRAEAETLSCSCPKCEAHIELSLSEVASEEPVIRSCPECKSRYVLTREPFACRASRKSGKINCANCGGELSHSQYCPSCKTLYPEYYAAEFPDAAKKRERQRHERFAWLKNFSFEWRTSKPATTGYHPTIAVPDAWQEPEHPSFWSRRRLTLAGSAFVIVAIFAVSFTLYTHIQAKKRYSSNYIMALYGIKVGSDLSIKLSKQLASDWTARANSGQNSPVRLSVDDENQLNSIKSRTDSYLQKLGSPPGEFSEANDKLLQLNTIYSKVHAAAQNPAGAATGFIEATQKSEKEFQASVASLKQSLPPELSKELEVAKLKYKAMGDI